MLKRFFVCFLFLFQALLPINGEAQLLVLEEDRMQDTTGAAGICVPAVENACADKPQNAASQIPDNDRFKEVETSLKDIATPVQPDPNVKVLPETEQSISLAIFPKAEVKIDIPEPIEPRLLTIKMEPVVESQPLYIMNELSPPVSNQTVPGGVWASP